jgi:type I restriction enzyme R subunit
MSVQMKTEADTCREYVLPKLQAAGWDKEPYSLAEQRYFTDGRIIVAGTKIKRGKQKRADYLLRYRRDFTLAVVEAKPEHKKPADGMQQAKEYAEILGLKFAYSTNGKGIVEFDYFTGVERAVETFPTPQELFKRYRAGRNITDDSVADRLIEPYNLVAGKKPRYYQEAAINRVVEAILKGQQRVLVTMATGTGKTFVAFQVAWKLWRSRWNRTGEHRRPRILFLSDRNILVDDPKAKTFAPFGDARHKIGEGTEEPVKSREMYFAIYQQIARDSVRPGLYKQFAPDFFDLVIVDECHRGSADDESNWREILEHFQPAFQLGMTATPLREENKDTYRYFGNPVYTYSLKQGIQDGFLAPYRVHRVVTSYDATGWRPAKGQLDRFGKEIPDEVYGTPDFERIVALKARTEAIARHLTEFLKRMDRWGKTIVFCVDQEHADEMRRALNNLNADLVQKHSDYVVRITSDEGDIGRGHLEHFMDIESATPVLVTTSQLLSTGVDVQTCKNIAIVRMVRSMTEFKQIIGRGARVRDDYGKYFFSILDYTGSATRLFADPQFDGDPALITQEATDEQGTTTATEVVQPEEQPPADAGDKPDTDILKPDSDVARRKYYVDGGHVHIVAHTVQELDTEGKQIRVLSITQYAGEKVKTLFTTASDLRKKWADPYLRADVLTKLEDRGIDLDELRDAAGQPDADPLDLLCFLAYCTPLRSRRERAEAVRKERRDFFDHHTPAARQILDELLEKYAVHGVAQFSLPEVLKVPPVSQHGTVVEITNLFGGADRLKEAVVELQNLLYAS